MPWLSLLIFVPLAGMTAVAVAGKTKEICRWISLGSAVAVFALSLGALGAFWSAHQGQQVVLGGLDPAKNELFQSVLHEKAHWFSVAGLDVNYELDVDGLSMLLVALTGLIGVSAAIASWNIDRAPRGYHAMLLLLTAAMMGTFVAMDLFLFYVFWELMLLPMYFLIGVWGGPRREYAAIKFFMYTLVGSVLMLGAFLAFFFHQGTLSIPALVAHGADIFREHPGVRTALFFGLFVGFAIKVPVWPFHTWLPDAHVEAPTPISVILAAVLLKMGGYGLVRMAWPMFPDVVVKQGNFLCTLAVISIVYGALVAMAQKDWKKLVAYSSVSHMGYVLLGLTALTATSVNGAVFQMFNHGTISGMMFLLVGVMYDRVHHRDLDRFGGLLGMLPKYSVLAMIGFFAALGLPGMSGFVSEVMVFLGSFKSGMVLRTTETGVVESVPRVFEFGGESIPVMPHAVFFTIAGTLGIIFGAVYILTMVQRVFLGTPKEVGGAPGHGEAHGHGAAAALAPNPGHGGHEDAHDAAGGPDAPGGGGGHDVYVPPKAPWPDLQPLEWAALVPLAAVTIWLGIWPRAALDLFNPTMVALLDKMKVGG